jgi:putative transposase
MCLSEMLFGAGKDVGCLFREKRRRVSFFVEKTPDVFLSGKTLECIVAMPYRPGRGTAGIPFHVLNRGACRQTLFAAPLDYRAFVACLVWAMDRHPVRLLAYCLMPNHFHLVLQPTEDGQLSVFMKSLEGMHSKRWHARKSRGTGAVYQSRFKAFPIQCDRHFFAVCRYVERNALRARLVEKAEDWLWGSLARRYQTAPGPDLTDWPVERPDDWVKIVNESEPRSALADVRRSVLTGRPYGEPSWAETTARSLGIESTLQPRGRPKGRTRERDGDGEKDVGCLFP